MTAWFGVAVSGGLKPAADMGHNKDVLVLLVGGPLCLLLFGEGVTHPLVISLALATVSLGNLGATYDGTPKPATAFTNPPGLGVSFTYNGQAVAPVGAGIYTVIGSVNDTNYQGSATATATRCPGCSASGFHNTPPTRSQRACRAPLCCGSATAHSPKRQSTTR